MASESQLPSIADFERLEGELFDRITVRHRRRVVRHRLVVAAAVVAIAGAGIAAGTVASPQQQGTAAYCYAGDSLNSQVAQSMLPNNASFALKHGSRPSAAQIADIVSLCKGGWAGGIFSKSSSTGPFAVPKLQACLRDDLVVAVFPKKARAVRADAFCNSLGLTAP
jgi:hypothetical protein